MLILVLFTIQIAKAADADGDDEEKTEASATNSSKSTPSLITPDDTIEEWPPDFNEFTDRHLAPDLDDEI